MQVIAGPAGPQNIGSSSLRVFYFRIEVCQPSFTEQKLLLLTTASLSREKRIFQFLRITVNFSVVWLRRNAFEAGKAFFRSQSKLLSLILLINVRICLRWCIHYCSLLWIFYCFIADACLLADFAGYISLLLAYIMLSRPARNKRLAAQVVIDVVITRITALLLCYC